MAGNGSSVTTQPLLTIFNGEKYEYWSIKIKTLSKSQELWDVVEQGITANRAGSNEEQRLNKKKKKKKRDAKALFFIQQAVHESIFFKNSSSKYMQQCLETLQTEYKGSSKVITVKLQSLRCDFGTLHMKNGKLVHDYLSRVDAIVDQMWTYAEEVSIEESKDLTTYSFDELMRSLQSHEARLTRASEKNGKSLLGEGRGVQSK
ncbi:hypothetical protein Pint_11938 [Pistacia integerrima]|uniref:Uncharacterized protein n=1 Tax=Pistacia integerrima TaxID=434235 RepID=A0ACC0XH85_9ROSI|nr:hypothetical protein Pint_11938 [Pistacia integerrima]